MITLTQVRFIALSFEEAEEFPHFEKTSFRVKKKIFATYDSKNNRVCLKLSEVDQSIFTAFDPSSIYPVPNKWGKQGWTFLEIGKVKEDMFLDAITLSYCSVAPKKLGLKYSINRII